MKTFTLPASSIAACKTHRLDVKHYREDGTCRCTPDPKQPKVKKLSTKVVTFVAVGPFAWGKGEMVSKAANNCRREIPRSMLRKGKHPIYVYRVTAFDYVNDNGGVVVGKGGTCEKVDTQHILVK
jgi:hypothetical protein